MLRTAFVLLGVLGLPQVAAPPATATLSGLVVARDGGFLPGVTVTLEGPAPAAPRKVVTDREGRFRLADIPPATYTARFELSGFVTYSRPRLVLAAGTPASLTVALEVGPLREPIDRAAPPIGETRPALPRPAPMPTFTLADGEVAVGIETSVGTFHIAVDTKRAPITATNFLKYVDAGLYDQGRFHRATRADNYTPSLPNRPMMNIIQGGINPERRAQGFPAIPLERTSVTGIRHVTGVVSMARGTGADTATSDFFVLLDDQPSLDFGGLRFDDGQGGAAFGHVLSGLDVVRKIQQQPVDGQNLSAPVTIRRAWRVGSAQ
jgi:peptidyl-prolyl cis-trans isomerase A (cyclophilin A)